MLFKNPNKCLDKNPKFIFDEACVDIINKLNTTVTVFGQYEDCYKCNFQNLTVVEPFQNTSILVNTIPLQLQYYSENNNTHCNLDTLPYEHYRYGWNISEKCGKLYIKEPADDAYLPILSAFIILFCFGTMWYLVKCIYKFSGRFRRLLVWNSVMEEDLGSSSNTPLVIERPPSVRKHPHRIKSVDVFRGLCITVMIFVNYGGGQYWFFKHSVWNGLTIADLVFPWFMWLMGFSLTVSMQSKLRRAIPRRQLLFQIIRRSIILIFLGIIINSHKNRSAPFAQVRIPGVLQRFGICYLVVGLLEVAFTKRTESEEVTFLHDIKATWPQWIIVSLLVTIHTCITFLVEVPGCGKGYLGPGGLENGGNFYNCTGGVAGYIDRKIFGDHMYKGGAVHTVYETDVNFDPEGFLGTLTAILMVYLGVQAGRIFKTYGSVRGRTIRWVVWGLFTGFIGAGLSEFSRNEGVIPINKPLWSLSYVLILAGMAFIIQTFLFVIVDTLKKWGGRPLFYPGMNAIFLYMGHEIFNGTFPIAWKPSEDTHSAYLFMNLWSVFIWVAIAIYMYKRNIFFSI